MVMQEINISLAYTMIYFNNHFCSDFRYESNGIFVLRVGFFSDKFRLFN